MDDQKIKQNANMAKMGFVQKAIIKNVQKTQQVDPDVEQEYDNLMKTAEKQLSDDETTKSDELINTKITDQEIPGFSNGKISVAQEQSELSADSFDEAD